MGDYKTLDDKICKECKTAVTFICCNAKFRKEEHDAKNWDWWMRCSNKECINSKGEGIFQDDPEWVINNGR